MGIGEQHRAGEVCNFPQGVTVLQDEMKVNRANHSPSRVCGSWAKPLAFHLSSPSDDTKQRKGKKLSFQAMIRAVFHGMHFKGWQVFFSCF